MSLNSTRGMLSIIVGLKMEKTTLPGMILHILREIFGPSEMYVVLFGSLRFRVTKEGNERNKFSLFFQNYDSSYVQPLVCGSL